MKYFIMKRSILRNRNSVWQLRRALYLKYIGFCFKNNQLGNYFLLDIKSQVTCDSCIWVVYLQNILIWWWCLFLVIRCENRSMFRRTTPHQCPCRLLFWNTTNESFCIIIWPVCWRERVCVVRAKFLWHNKRLFLWLHAVGQNVFGSVSGVPQVVRAIGSLWKDMGIKHIVFLFVP